MQFWTSDRYKATVFEYNNNVGQLHLTKIYSVRYTGCEYRKKRSDVASHDSRSLFSSSRTTVSKLPLSTAPKNTLPSKCWPTYENASRKLININVHALIVGVGRRRYVNEAQIHCTLSYLASRPQVTWIQEFKCFK